MYKSTAFTFCLAGGMMSIQHDEIAEHESYKKVIENTIAMVTNVQAQRLVNRLGLQIVNLTWEDTGRYKGSSVGPNISDMTIQIQQMDPRSEKFHLYCMPVIRFPNFQDRTVDLSLEKFQLLVGNESHSPLQYVTLTEFLGHIRKYLCKANSWKGDRESLLADRDSHALVSAQACFLPIPRHGSATFNPVLFNYQSAAGDPAVLTVLATREGTSVTVIDNKRDAFKAGPTWGQRLFFNLNGERASLTGKRQSEFVQETQIHPKNASTPEANEQSGLNMVLLIQVPLKQKHPMTFAQELGAPGGMPLAKAAMAPRSDVENAVIGHGKVEGPFTEIDGLDIQRDARFPIRVTVQFYKATSNGLISVNDLAEIAAQIEKVYAHADYVGSLVTQGHTGRPTEYSGEKTPPADWWKEFWNRHEANTGMTRDDTMRMLRRLFGSTWSPRTEKELANAVEQAAKKDK